MVVETLHYLYAAFSFEPRLTPVVLFKGVKLANINMAACVKGCSNFPEDVIKVLNMFQHQTETYKIVQPVSEYPFPC